MNIPAAMNYYSAIDQLKKYISLDADVEAVAKEISVANVVHEIPMLEFNSLNYVLAYGVILGITIEKQRHGEPLS
jgi:hypothetical protein